MTATTLAAFARAVGFFARAPGLSRAGIPAAVRAVFAFALALAVAPSLGAAHARDAASLTVLLAGEALCGAVFGVSATLIAEAAAAAGRMLDDLVGLRASVPGIAIAPSGFGGLWTLTFVAAFFALGGVERLIVAFAHSFTVVPLGASLDPGLVRHVGIGLGAAFARLSFELAAPAICASLCLHLGLGALTRTIPRFASLSLAFPVAYAAVLLVAFSSLTVIRDLGNGH